MFIVHLYLHLLGRFFKEIFAYLYHRTNVLCCKERSPQKKKYSNSKVMEENIAVVYYSTMIAATRKVNFSCILLLPSSWWLRGVGESWLFDTRRTDWS